MFDPVGLARQLTRLDELDGTAYCERYVGADWPDTAETMIGIPRLANIWQCLTQAVADRVSGDFAECGVWRGGACIMAAATLADIAPGRTVWVCDSFQGIPEPTYPLDLGGTAHTIDALKVSADEVRANFERYGLLTDRVRFVEGWFVDTLPGPIGDLAVLRCDGDLYSSTWETLTALYDHVQPGGYVIVDDYGCVRQCRTAVEDFREERNVLAPLQTVEHGCGAVWWQKEG